VTCTEQGLPIECAPDAWRWLHSRLSQYWKSGLRPVDMIAHSRFTGPSRSLLASASGRASCHFEVLSHVGNTHRALFHAEFDEKMGTAFGGRPHWGKQIANPWRLAASHDRDSVELFLEIRAELDPEQRFLNPWLRDSVFALGRRRRGESREERNRTPMVALSA
jgi:FAD/FMN-containing dehydrogenase